MNRAEEILKIRERILQEDPEPTPTEENPPFTVFGGSIQNAVSMPTEGLEEGEFDEALQRYLPQPLIDSEAAQRDSLMNNVDADPERIWSGQRIVVPFGSGSEPPSVLPGIRTVAPVLPHGASPRVEVDHGELQRRINELHSNMARDTIPVRESVGSLLPGVHTVDARHNETMTFDTPEGGMYRYTMVNECVNVEHLDTPVEGEAVTPVENNHVAAMYRQFMNFVRRRRHGDSDAE